MNAGTTTAAFAGDPAAAVTEVVAAEAAAAECKAGPRQPAFDPLGPRLSPWPSTGRGLVGGRYRYLARGAKLSRQAGSLFLCLQKLNYTASARPRP